MPAVTPRSSLRRSNMAAWIADHRVRLACAALGAALVGLGVLADIAESRGADLIGPALVANGGAMAPAIPAVTSSRPAEPVTVGFRMPPLSQYGEVTERPLFSPDRRPHQAAPQGAAAPLPFSLRGIVVQPKGHYALIEEGTPAVSRRVSEGETLGGGTVKEIQRDRIVLSLNGGETVIRLFEPSTTNGKRSPALPAGGPFSQGLPASATGAEIRLPTSGG